MILRIVAAGVVIAIATPSGGQVANRFDGLYDLRSTAPVPGAAADGHRPCSLDLHVKTLHITAGHASEVVGGASAVEGVIGADGAFTLMNPEMTRELTGRVEVGGLLRGYLNTFDGCGYDLVFRRRVMP